MLCLIVSGGRDGDYYCDIINGQITSRISAFNFVLFFTGARDNGVIARVRVQRFFDYTSNKIDVGNKNIGPGPEASFRKHHTLPETHFTHAYSGAIEEQIVLGAYIDSERELEWFYHDL